MPDWEALPFVIDIEGDEALEQRQAFPETLLADRRGAEEQVDELYSDGCCFTVGAYGGGGSVGRGRLVAV